MTSPVVIRWSPDGWFVCHRASYQSAVRGTFPTRADAVAAVERISGYVLTVDPDDALGEAMPVKEYWSWNVSTRDALADPDFRHYNLFGPLQDWELRR
jgi:hypothetical protein